MSLHDDNEKWNSRWRWSNFSDVFFCKTDYAKTETADEESKWAAGLMSPTDIFWALHTKLLGSEHTDAIN